MSLSSLTTAPLFVTKIISLYGLNYTSIAKGQKGYRNTSYAVTLSSGDVVNLIIYKREPEILHKIANAHYLGNILAATNLPIRKQIEMRLVKMLGSEDQVRYAALYSYLPGTTIPWEAYTQDHLKQMGKTLGHMHCSLRGKPQVMLPDVIDESQTLLGRMQEYFADPGVQSALHKKLHLTTLNTHWEGFAHTMSAAKSLGDMRPLHMDFVRGNILFEDNTLSGVIDFEKAAFGPPVFDVARSLAFLIVDSKYKQSDKVRKYFLYSGYVKRGGMKLGELGPAQLRESLTTFYLLHDFYKFLLHNPYQFLQHNEHYVRTRNILIERGELQVI